MARDESIRGLYMRLGLDFDELNQGFVQASRTLKSNMASLSRENTIIRLQTEVDLSNVEDADQRLAVQTESLNRQLEIQRQRLRLATASLTSFTRAEGESSDNAQRARISVERERLALSRLERELRNLNETQNSTNAGTQNLTEAFGSIAGKFAPAIAGFVAVEEGLAAVSETATEVVENFKELSKQSYELNMPVQKTKDFLQTLRLGGGDIGDFEGYIRGITDAYVKGDVDDPEFIALSKYGAKITDVTGRLKDFKEITEEVYQAWKKAEAAGEGIEFLQLTGGESGIRDAIQLFKRYEEAKDDAGRLFKVEIDYSFGMTFPNLQIPLVISKNGTKTAEIDLTPFVDSLKRKFSNLRTKMISENDQLSDWMMDNGTITALRVGIYTLGLTLRTAKAGGFLLQ